MKRSGALVLACALLLAVGSTAVAQTVPAPVVRMGDWIELSDEVWMNLIFTTEWIYQTNHNNDFENDIQDRTGETDNQGTIPHYGDCDCLWEETRFGADLRYQKNLRVRILFEHQATLDGNRIDNGWSEPTELEGRQRNNVNLERAYIQYDVPNTGLTMEVGADLWTTDQAGVLGDDDPRFALFYKAGNLELQAGAVIQTESLRIGLENDNDDVYYTFGLDYNLKPWQFGVHGAYFRYRNDGAVVQPTVGQKLDSVLIMPSVRGQFSIVQFLVQPMVIFGSADRSDAGVAAFGGRSMDIFSWGVIGAVEANLGIIRPFFAFAIGSGDEDPNDDDLEGFAPTPHREITLTTGEPEFAVLDRSPSWGGRDTGVPARANIGTGTEFMHTVGNPFGDRVGNGLSGLTTTYTNAGTFTLAPGVKIFPVKGHELDLFYVYRAVMESAPLEQDIANRFAIATSVDEAMTHEVSAFYTWTISKHFNIQAFGSVFLAASGGQDIAESQDCDAVAAGLQPCKGEDVGLRGSLRFRAAF
jgi:hypothetical protein